MADPDRIRDRWRRRLGRFASGARRGLELVPLTPRGVLVTVASAFALWYYGFGTLDLVLFVMGIAGLAMVALAALTVVAAAVVSARRVPRSALAPQRLEAGSPIRTGFRLRGLDRWPLVDLGWRWEHPGAVAVRWRVAEGELLEEAVANRRCLVATVRRRFEVGDVFGLARLAWRRRASTPILALPSVGRLRTMPVVQSIAAAEGLPHAAGMPEGDRMEIRRYAPGDSIRHILWKTYARTRELNVRLPERSVDRARRTVAYLVTGTGDEPAAAAARVALERGALGEDWSFAADGSPEPTGELEPALRAIARSGSWCTAGAPPSAGGLGTFLGRIGQGGAVHCVVFAPAVRGPWLDAALAAARAFAGSVSFVLATDGVVHGGGRALWRRLLFVARPSDGTPAQELASVVRALQAGGRRVLVVDRASGRSYGQEHQRILATGAAA